jgi:hypothetical protein
MEGQAMSILDSHPGLLAALSGEMTPKFLASRSTDGVPNVVPVTSTMPAGDVPDRLIFGNFLLRKTVRLLDVDPRVGLLVITTDLEAWVLQGDFVGWQRSGPYVDQLNSTDLLRYNAYTGIRNAGIVEVHHLLSHFRLSKGRVLSEYLLARLARIPPRAEDAVALPGPAQKRFALLSKVAVLAYLASREHVPSPAQMADVRSGPAPGYPIVAPLLSLQPKGNWALVCAPGLASGLMAQLEPGAAVAAALLTLDIVSFQAKGRWLGSQRRLGAPLGAMAVTSVYAGGPPMPGRRIA